MQADDLRSPYDRTPDDPPQRVLVLGATGYVGGRLTPELVARGHEVRCLARTPSKLDNRPWRTDVDVVEGDLLDPATLTAAFEGVDTVYYLVHSMGAGDGFEERERNCAENARKAAEAAGVDQIVYLGGLGDPEDDLSPHLRSRQTVGRVLADGSVSVTELRAAVVLGSGSASFEMLRGLTEVLPAMITPRWVQQTRCQPIAVRDVLRRLLAVLGRSDTTGVWEIGGTDVVTYAEMMNAYAEVVGLPRRLIVPVPVLTPGLSSKWVDLVTSLPSALATELVGSLQNDVVVRDRPLTDVLPLDALDLHSALEEALAAVQDLDVSARWTSGMPLSSAALPRPWDPEWAGGTVLEDHREITIDAPTSDVMAEVRRLGGTDGWLGYDLLWKVRGWGDALIGGVGGRRGRRHADELGVGDAVDLFVVDETTPTSLRLRAEMKMPGFGWLEWTSSPTEEGRTLLVQTARFVPKGLLGRLYWLVLVPVHHLVFERLLEQISIKARTRAGRREVGFTATGTG